MTRAPLAFTAFTSEVPDRLTKVLSIKSDGSLEKQSAANMARGRAERRSVTGLRELARSLDALKPNQAVAWGVTEHADATVVPEADEADELGAISRTRRHFAFAKSPGVVMLDHDGAPGESLSVDELRARLIEACPPLADAPMLWRPSASAGVVGPDGRSLSPLDRCRLYLPVADASLIPEAGRRLVDLLWSCGRGWIEVGNAGQALLRTLVDASVWSPERLDFAAPPILRDGLSRPHVAPKFFGDPEGLFDLALIEAAPTVSKAANAARQAARKDAKGECAAQRERWASERAPGLASERGIAESKARDILTRASEHAVLMGDFTLTAQGGARVSVGRILDNPDHWHNKRFADPLGSYPNDDRVAVVNLMSGGRPSLFTHGHGGIRFELMRQAERVQIGRGLRVQATDAALAVLRVRGELYEFGEGALAYASAGRARSVSVEWLTDHMGRVCEFYSVRSNEDAAGNRTASETPEDAPTGIAKAIIAKAGERGFKRLHAVINAPTLRGDGSILDRPGYDEASGLLYLAADDAERVSIPSRPTVDEALDALAELWAPVAAFPLVTDIDRAVLLHGLMTATLRACLPTAPGVALNAPTAGTGKTLLARCIGILATGTEPAILPPADSDEEVRKRLFSVLREGARVVLWDNVREPLGCAALDSFLTAAHFADRVLGSSETASLPNRAVFIATGNNLRLVGDTCRRVFVARLDAQIERPYARDFASDPAQRVTADRQRLVAAALTITRAHIAAGRPKVGEGRTASFETWDDLVRQPICWLATHVRRSDRADLPSISDPLAAADLAFEQDPETTKLAAFLAAWRSAFGASAVTVAAAIQAAHMGDEVLRDALDEIAGQGGGRINPRILGRWIERHVDRRKDGSRITRAGRTGGVVTWRVNADRPETNHLNPPKPPCDLDGDGLEDGLDDFPAGREVVSVGLGGFFDLTSRATPCQFGDGGRGDGLDD